ncbi:hypothetical protein FQN51_002907 [Onygenales sp. PD_10]|nr:hypothetical protein FQN51_002907 [Onygenales sp. PD_10]
MISIKQIQAIRPPPGIDTSIPRHESLRYVYMVTAFVSIGALLFGYGQGVMGVIVADERWQDLMKPKSSWVSGMVISLYDVGCFIGSMAVGSLADIYGRERTLALSSVIFVIGAVLQAASYSIAQITIGRIVLGVAVGVCAAGVPLYVSEIAPPKLRGRIIGIEQMILCLGELFAFWLNYGLNFIPMKDWWRIPLAIQIVPAVIFGVGCWYWVPPSPRWLVAHDRHACALEVLTRCHGSEAAELEIQEIQASVKFERTVTSAGWKEMFNYPVIKVTVLGMAIQFFQQITGTNSILYYTVRLVHS